jgi:rhamnose utilization protein RhaD (predicted bifunctional aldolase and dehydrogenase)/NAD(P)-dependent dehydrogenase (short-subunit alcohol dehydrogenase family)
MLNRWNDDEARRAVEQYGSWWGDDLAQRTYSSRLIGSEPDLVLHGGGNTSVKTIGGDVFDRAVPMICVKASGVDMAQIDPEGHPGLELEPLKALRRLTTLDDDRMVNEFRRSLLHHTSPTPSIETLLHAFLPHKFVDHTHADAILILSNQQDGARRIEEALGRDVILLDYVEPGFPLARAAIDAFESKPQAIGMVLLRHGLVTWGDTARESYARTIELVDRADALIAKKASRRPAVISPTSLDAARARLRRIAPIVRGQLAEPTGDPDQPHRRTIVLPLVTRETLDFLDSRGAKATAMTPPLTSDHLIRTRAFPLWIDTPRVDDDEALRAQIVRAFEEYAERYAEHVTRSGGGEASISRRDTLPRVVLIPGVGALCAGRDAAEAAIARDITAHTLKAKAAIAAMGAYQGLSDAELLFMEYRGLQQVKLAAPDPRLLAGRVALITGAAGAIGSGLARVLVEHGCHLAVTDLPGEPLTVLGDELGAAFPGRVCVAPLDVTDPASVAEAFGAAIETWGGLDLIVVNAGIAHVAALADLTVDAFRRLERVNVEGTLTVLAEAARHFALQRTGGDIVLVSTKNVFAPGAKFGAYSATKAAAHQLARIASLELAEHDVRVNMVAPDAVFSEGARKSGLWAEVGPDRMRARGLTEEGLEDYYRNRNLLKAKVTARHVANAVVFFASRQTPTTGATMPVDGGLPDATPR